MIAGYLRGGKWVLSSLVLEGSSSSRAFKGSSINLDNY